MEKQKITNEQDKAMTVAKALAQAFSRISQDKQNTTTLYIKGVVAGVELAEASAKSEVTPRTA